MLESVRLAQDLHAHRVQSVVFARSRRSVELMLTYLQAAERQAPARTRPGTPAPMAHECGFIQSRFAAIVPDISRPSARDRAGIARRQRPNRSGDQCPRIGHRHWRPGRRGPCRVPGIHRQCLPAGRARRPRLDPARSPCWSHPPIRWINSWRITPTTSLGSRPSGRLINPDHLLDSAQSPALRHV